MKKTENDSTPLIDGKTKAVLSLTVIGGLLFMLLRLIFTGVLLGGSVFLIYGLFLLVRGVSSAKIYLLAGAGIIVLGIIVLMLCNLLGKRKKDKE